MKSQIKIPAKQWVRILRIVNLSKVKHTDPSWPAYWYIRPLIIVPLAGVAAGVVYYFIGKLCSQLSWQKYISVIAGFLVYIVALWMGAILGLAGTLWD